MFGWSPVGVLKFFAKASLIFGLFYGGMLLVSPFFPSLNGGLPLSYSTFWLGLTQAAFTVGGGILVWAVLSALASVTEKLEHTSQT